MFSLALILVGYNPTILHELFYSGFENLLHFIISLSSLSLCPPLAPKFTLKNQIIFEVIALSSCLT